MTDILLLHGMCVGAWEWERVIPLLEADPRVGRVVAPDFPGRGAGRPADLSGIGLRDYLATGLRALREHDLRDVLVVGHSGGGVTMPALAAAEPERVRRLIFLCAAIPRRGESLLDLQPQPWRTFSRLWLRLFAGRRGIVPNRRLARRALCHDLLPEDCAISNRLVAEPRALLTDRISWPAERARAPATYIHTTLDRVVRPKDQLRMARSIPGVEIVPMASGHAHPIVYPEKLVEVVLSHV